MFKLILISCALAGAAFGQGQHYNSDPKTAAILTEQRYLSGDGKFGASYTQEDGINFKEETDSDGTRRGSYSYIDPSGQRKTISYTAGKNGFQASGDHLPVAPAAPPQPVPTSGYQPNSQYQPQQPQQYHQQAAPQPQYNSNSNDYDDGQYDPRYNDPSFSQGVQRPHNPAPPAYHAPQPTPQTSHFNHNFQQAPQHYNPPPPPQHYTTQNPHRFQPPGKLSLNRTPDGFSYTFNKV